MRHHDLGLRSGGVGSLALSRFFRYETPGLLNEALSSFFRR